MAFHKISSPSLTEMFVEQLEGMILSGELRTGEQLPSSRSLCEMMGVSRPVVTAGLAQLEQMGFVKIRPRRGVFVTDYRRKGTIETLDAIMRYNGGRMRKEEVQSLFEVRDSLDRLAARLVVERATQDDLARLRQLAAEARATTTPEQEAEAAYAFYHEVTVISGNMILPLVYHSFKSESEYLWTKSVRLSHKGLLVDDIDAVLGALLERDADEAARQLDAIWTNALIHVDELAN